MKKSTIQLVKNILIIDVIPNRSVAFAKDYTYSKAFKHTCNRTFVGKGACNSRFFGAINIINQGWPFFN